MNFDLSEEQQMLQETVKQYLENECPPQRLREIFDGEVGMDAALWQGMAEMGIAGLQLLADPNAWVKVVPSRASRSRFGVLTMSLPMKPA